MRYHDFFLLCNATILNKSYFIVAWQPPQMPDASDSRAVEEFSLSVGRAQQQQTPLTHTITWSLPPPSGVIWKQQSNITSAHNDEHEGGRLRRKLEAAEQMSSQTGSCAGHHLPSDQRYAQESLRSYSNVIFYTAICTYSPTHVRTEHKEHTVVWMESINWETYMYTMRHYRESEKEREGESHTERKSERRM